MAHYNMAFAADEFDRMDTSLNDYPEPEEQVSDSQDTKHQSTNTSKISGQPKLAGCFTFVDFCPEYRRKPDAWFFQADYETFSEIFHKVNEWLSDNPKWEVKTAETLIYDSTTGFGQKLPFFAGKLVKRNLRGVRLWLIPRLHQRSQPQKIGCINVVPRLKITNNHNNSNNNEINIINNNTNEMVDTVDSDITEAVVTSDGDKSPTSSATTTTTTPTNTSGTQSSFLSSKPTYETLDEMLIRVNDLFVKKPINGRVLSVETVPIPVECNNWSVDTEQSYWSDEHQKNNNTVYILRIYFEYGNQSREQLEIIDFVPKVQIWDAPLAVPVYESFSSLLKRSSEWLREQAPGLRFLSCTTVEAPIDYAFNTESIKENLSSDQSSVDSRRMFYAKPNNGSTSNIVINTIPPLTTGSTTSAIDTTKTISQFVTTNEFSLKFVRLAIARPQQSCPESHFPPNREPVVLNCKIFVPTKLANALNANAPDYETVNTSKRKIEAWLMATGAKVLSAETTMISVPFSSSSIATAVDSCLKSNSSTLGHYLTVYRIYLDGHCLEPPARLLPVNLADNQQNTNQSDQSNCSLM